MILVISAVAVLSVILFSKVAGITPTPTSAKARRALFELLPDVDGPVYELGAGWGTLTGRLARRYSRVIGYELSPLPWLIAWLRGLSRRNLSVRYGSFWKTDLSKAALVVCYLYPGAMKRLPAHLPKGSLVLTHTFAIPGLTPLKQSRTDDLYNTPVYLYQT